LPRRSRRARPRGPRYQGGGSRASLSLSAFIIFLILLSLSASPCFPSVSITSAHLLSSIRTAPPHTQIPMSIAIPHTPVPRRHPSAASSPPAFSSWLPT
ncbi:hypothetical protein BJ912DRAFT_997504, partial [Pholiota molesta]